MAEIEKDEPQIACSAFTKGMCHRWVYVQRTINGIDHLFKPLEHAIRTLFIPAILGRQISEDRKIIALPLRFRGLGIQDPTDTCTREYEALVSIADELIQMILDQNQNIGETDRFSMKEKKQLAKRLKEAYFEQEYNAIVSGLSTHKAKVLEMNAEKIS